MDLDKAKENGSSEALEYYSSSIPFIQTSQLEKKSIAIETASTVNAVDQEVITKRRNHAPAIEAEAGKRKIRNPKRAAEEGIKFANYLQSAIRHLNSALTTREAALAVDRAKSQKRREAEKELVSVQEIAKRKDLSMSILILMAGSIYLTDHEESVEPDPEVRERRVRKKRKSPTSASIVLQRK